MNLEPLAGPPGKSNALDWELKVPMGGLFQPSVSSIQPSEQSPLLGCRKFRCLSLIQSLCLFLLFQSLCCLTYFDHYIPGSANSNPHLQWKPPIVTSCSSCWVGIQWPLAVATQFWRRWWPGWWRKHEKTGLNRGLLIQDGRMWKVILWDLTTRVSMNWVYNPIPPTWNTPWDYAICVLQWVASFAGELLRLSRLI